MSKVDLKSKESDLIQSRDGVLNDESVRKWTIFGYDESGQSNTLNVEEEGESAADGGALDDLIVEFNSGRYQYGLAGVKIENRGIRVKIHCFNILMISISNFSIQHVLLIWQGEGTPILRKSACAHHAQDVIR